MSNKNTARLGRDASPYPKPTFMFQVGRTLRVSRYWWLSRTGCTRTNYAPQKTLTSDHYKK